MNWRLALFGATGFALLAGGVLLTAFKPDWGTAPPPATAKATPVHYRYIPNYIPTSPYKREMNGRFGPEFRQLRDRILTEEMDGSTRLCLTQMLTETRDLMNYTNKVDALRAQMDDLRASLDAPRKLDAFQQSSADGSYGGCFKAWYLRMHETPDPLKELAHNGKKPEHPLTFMYEVGTREKLRAHMESLLVSDLKQNGVDHRKELNLTITGLAQLLFMPKLAAMLPPDIPVKELAAELQDFLDSRAQDPETGFWGAWYMVDGELHKTNDLSITFHAISYRPNDPPHMKEMADTLFAIRTTKYPYGWRDQGTQNNHHAYDVARLLRRAWPHMTAEQKARSAAELTIMVARSLNVSIHADGSFDEGPYDSAAEAYYFGVSFLDEVGFFRSSRRFWTPLEVSDPESLRTVLLKNLRKLDQRNAMVGAALRKLEETD